MITLAAIRSARVETSENSNVFGEKLKNVYLFNVDATIEELHSPIDFSEFTELEEEDISTFRVTIEGKVYFATEFGGEYLAVSEGEGRYSFFKIVSL
ncbi:hypothetical protein WFC_00113 [Escherichia phage vB_EcoM_WFC]|uniref:Uncharacterized protein n=1 Tax=Escherichia phage vB_EcoM_WFC TaxID=2508193 RepID=A0A482MV91_9CAUD|nr:hypothetical protein HOV52_gp007 [Escherichia phage vB_EcoM_WFC]YP_009823666.1 hypothetical protein HOV52_gp113 [Escherichia phage vB_EcoM_WFC]QBQ77399.1 hypothetical protein WFC_00007 [Escherichia phage vB_EcoM_WFC]QBQ77505.1 hypothetical protein WFC_00113 [Escherichia phage vB_EcoM_WFC]